MVKASAAGPKGWWFETAILRYYYIFFLIIFAHVKVSLVSENDQFHSSCRGQVGQALGQERPIAWDAVQCKRKAKK